VLTFFPFPTVRVLFHSSTLEPMSSVDRIRQPVKSKRRYDASLRLEHARRNRDRILDAAERRFLSDGYAATTIAAIADDARISVDTIYKSFGGKPGLVMAINGRGLRGESPVPAEQRSDEVQAREADPRNIIRAWGAFVMEIAPRVAPFLLLVRDAAGSDPELRAVLEEMDADRLHRMTTNARRLHAAGHLRHGVTATHAADVLWTYSAIEMYELLVLRRGVSLKKFGEFVADAMIAALL
jgi:AcrR family transcriptional regulator